MTDERGPNDTDSSGANRLPRKKWTVPKVISSSDFASTALSPAGAKAEKRVITPGFQPSV
jgi:hypothetical protein